LRRPIIAGNWKLNKTVAQAVDFVVELQSLVDGTGDVEVVVAPAFTALSAVANALNNSSIGVQLKIYIGKIMELSPVKFQQK